MKKDNTRWDPGHYSPRRNLEFIDVDDFPKYMLKRGYIVNQTIPVTDNMIIDYAYVADNLVIDEYNIIDNKQILNSRPEINENCFNDFPEIEITELSLDEIVLLKEMEFDCDPIMDRWAAELNCYIQGYNLE